MYFWGEWDKMELESHRTTDHNKKRDRWRMYRVLLVDDEALIREAISENTDWEELGFVLAGTCKNGKEALEAIQKNPPDLLLTDICMPYMDGMELARRVYEEYQGIKIVIISGYDEFEYAKLAVKYQVAEYILKPITARELSDTLRKVKQSLDEAGSRNRSHRETGSRYRGTAPLIQERFFNSLLSGNVSRQEALEALERLEALEGGPHALLQNPCFLTGMIHVDQLGGFLEREEGAGKSLAYFSVLNAAGEILKNHGAGIAFQDAQERTLLLFAGDRSLPHKAYAIGREIQRDIRERLGIPCTIALGSRAEGVDKIQESASAMRKAMDQRFLLGGDRVIGPEDWEALGDRRELDVPAMMEPVLRGIRSLDQQEIRDRTEDFIEALRTCGGTKNRTIFFIQNAVLSVMGGLESGLSGEEDVLLQERELLNAVYSKEYLREVEEELIRFFLSLSARLQEQKDGFGKRQALLALDYIEKNYGNPEVSLNSVCTYLAMSTSYFSSVFKEQTGETFIEALTRKRIDRAKELLENTSRKTCEIAWEVGYSDPHYFSSTFKKMTGMTPRSYGRKVRDK